jgi:hypothetical protein
MASSSSTTFAGRRTDDEESLMYTLGRDTSWIDHPYDVNAKIQKYMENLRIQKLSCLPNIERDTFSSCDELKMTVSDEAVRKGFQFSTPRRDKERYFVKCTSCAWMLRAWYQVKETCWKVTSVLEHSCEPVIKGNTSADWVSSKVFDIVKDINKRDFSPGDLVVIVKCQFGIDISYTMAYRAKQKAIAPLSEGEGEQYAKLRSLGRCIWLIFTNGPARAKCGRSLIFLVITHLRLYCTSRKVHTITLAHSTASFIQAVLF